MKKKSLGIQEIKYGEVHCFCPLKFENDKSFEVLCDSILHSKVFFSDEYQNKIRDSLGFSSAQTVKAMNEMEEGQDVKVSMQDFEKYSSMDSAPLDINKDDIRLEVDFTESSIKTYLISMELEELVCQEKRLIYEQGLFSRIYGPRFVTYQNRFILHPLRVELSNGRNTWLNATLYIFANGMGILKLWFPIINMGTDALKESNLDALILKIDNRLGTEEIVSDLKLSNVAAVYINLLMKDIGAEIRLYGGEINYISLINYDGIPRRINTAANEVLEDLYRIVASPVPERKNISYIRKAQGYIKDNSWGDQDINYVAKITGGCLAYIDQSVLDIAYEEYKAKQGCTDLDERDYFEIHQDIASDIFCNVELALLIIMLKKMNDCNCYYEKINELGNLDKIQIEYNKNVIFINELQEECFGSVSEQIEFLERAMHYYLKPEIMKEKLLAIDNILRIEREKKEGKFQSFITIGGFLISLIFGFPAIYDTITIIRKLLFFIPADVPYLTVESVSALVWIVFNGVLFLMLYRRYR